MELNRPFVDYYEVLQLSPNANADTVERVYRLLAKRLHPDNQQTGDKARFIEVCQAYDVLSDPVRRAQYDVSYESHRGTHVFLARDASSTDTRDDDRQLFHSILSVLCSARRRDPRQGGLGSVHLERMLGRPQEHLAFPLWYLKQHKFVETLDNGQIAITVTGVDKLGELDNSVSKTHLLPPSAESDEERNR